MTQKIYKLGNIIDADGAFSWQSGGSDPGATIDEVRYVPNASKGQVYIYNGGDPYAITLTDDATDEYYVEGDYNQLLGKNFIINGKEWPAGTQIVPTGQITFVESDTGETYVAWINSIDTSSAGVHTETEFYIWKDGKIPSRGAMLTVAESSQPSRLRYSTISEEVESVDAACFVSGTLIETSSGLRLVEELKAGDAVRTLDNGYRKILWIGSWDVDSIDLLYKPKLYPIRIRAGSLGENMPSRDLVVSRQHRILIGSEISKQMFGFAEVMVPAIGLVDCDGISIEDNARSVTYWHVLLEDHEVLFAEGAMVESMYLGRIAIRSLSSAARKEISLIFPGISDPDFFYPPARKFIETRESVRKFVYRYKQKNMPMITDKSGCRGGPTHSPTSWPKA